MKLLTHELRLRLPALGSQAKEAEPIIYAHFHIPDLPCHWYVAEGSPADDDFLFFGFHIGSECEADWSWKKFRLSELEVFSGLEGAIVVRDLEFLVGRFTDVVSYPYLHRDFGDP